MNELQKRLRIHEDDRDNPAYIRDLLGEAADRIDEMAMTIDYVRGALADIGGSDDMTKEQMKHKAMRIWRATEPAD